MIHDSARGVFPPHPSGLGFLGGSGVCSMVEARFFVDFVLETVASSLDVFCGVVAHSELTMALEDVVRLGSGGDGTTKLLPYTF